MINKKCDCAKTEKYGNMIESPPTGMAQHIRYGSDMYAGMAQNIRYAIPGDPTNPSGMAQRIRYGDGVSRPLTDGMAQRIRYGMDDVNLGAFAQHVNMNNDFQGRLKNHIRRDSKMEMISNLMTGSK